MSLELSKQLQVAAMRKYFPFSQQHNSNPLLDLYIGSRYKYTNPFRPDSTPGCHFGWDKEGRLKFFDFATDKFYAGDCVQIIMRRFSMSFKDALNLVKNDFELQQYSTTNTQEIMQPESNGELIEHTNTRRNTEHTDHVELGDKLEETKWRIVSRKWNNEDKKFWYDRYGITSKLLEQYNIVPVQRATRQVFLGCEQHFYQYEQDSGDPCYCYMIDERIKLYRPYNKKMKWIGNVKKDNVQGYTQLPEHGDVVVIAASMKDALCLISVGINAIAPQSETMFIPDSTLADLKERFGIVAVLYDLDDTGKTSTKKHCQQHSLWELYLPQHIADKHNCKDVADFREKLGADEFEYGINNMIEELIQRVIESRSSIPRL